MIIKNLYKKQDILKSLRTENGENAIKVIYVEYMPKEKSYFCQAIYNNGLGTRQVDFTTKNFITEGIQFVSDIIEKEREC